MTDRKCSCCGAYYTDEKGHDYDECVDLCKHNLNHFLKETVNAIDDFQRACDNKIASLKEQLKNKEVK